jgi:hypothetical protein
MMINSSETDCPLCPTEITGHTELRIHLMVEHRKSAVIDEYIDRLDRRDDSLLVVP